MIVLVSYCQHQGPGTGADGPRASISSLVFNMQNTFS